MGKAVRDTSPTTTITMERTEAKMGRSMKNRELTGGFLFWLGRPAVWGTPQDWIAGTGFTGIPGPILWSPSTMTRSPARSPSWTTHWLPCHAVA